MDRERYHLPRAVPSADPVPRIKLITLGASNTGKSCLVKRFCEKKFVTKYIATIGIDYGVMTVPGPPTRVKVNFWDMAGAKAYYHVRNEFYKDAHAALLCFDVTTRATFLALDAWLDELQKHASDSATAIKIYLVANKIDMIPRVISPLEGQAFAQARKLEYFECTSALGDSVDVLLNTVITDVLGRCFSGDTAAIAAAKAETFQPTPTTARLASPT
ncbi:hypothetical protein RI367_003914 [Sorochytrium milnesiophthora]